MRARALAAAEAMRRTPPVGIPAREASATADFLEWMADNHFTSSGIESTSW